MTADNLRKPGITAVYVALQEIVLCLRIKVNYARKSDSDLSYCAENIF